MEHPYPLALCKFQHVLKEVNPKCNWLKFISQCLPKTGQSVGVQSLVRTLFLLAILFTYIFPYIDLSILAQTLNP